ncbi:hypothetical protein KIN20_004255 [Parelaphostrongylus tenuis]|uniref:Uncharacterized protein n=1 Tax=Parelaphostrongylus tenuis TaxID=148309 RepID=A0AAD5MH07_PARTN|nr:hypothetical protein KIN20_004255 [Parelaphostrongylus tenuis]
MRGNGRLKRRHAGAKGNLLYQRGSTVASICDMPPAAQQPQRQPAQPMCMVMHRSTVPVQHQTISGTLSTTNIIMANWSTQMWQDVMNRVARSLASEPFGLQFFGASVTVGKLETLAANGSAFHLYQGLIISTLQRPLLLSHT